MLGNDRANRFWAARLPHTEAIAPDSGAEQRRDFITRKYREGRYRLPHPHYGTQEEVLQVGHTWRSWQTPQSSRPEGAAPPAWLGVLAPSCQADFGGLCPGLAALEQPWEGTGVSTSWDGPQMHLFDPRRCARRLQDQPCSRPSCSSSPPRKLLWPLILLPARWPRGPTFGGDQRAKSPGTFQVKSTLEPHLAVAGEVPLCRWPCPC